MSKPGDPVQMDFIRTVENLVELGLMSVDLDRMLISHLATRVEAVDPASNTLLASELLPGLLRPLPGGLAAIAVRNPGSADGWKIVRLNLRGR